MTKKIFKILVAGIVTSFFMFPFVFKFFPVANTKNILAGCGLVLFAFRLAQNKETITTRQVINLFVMAAIVSLCGIISITYNGTNDYAYATYVVSMSIWLSAAYVVYMVYKYMHKDVTLPIVINYFLGVCVFQCIMALLIDNVEFVRDMVHTFLPPMDFMEEVNRLYGIGASLDVAGSRFSAILVMTAYMIVMSSGNKQKKYLWMYILGYLVVAIIGNMIARTTTVGMLLSLPILLFPRIFVYRDAASVNLREVWKLLIVFLILVIPVVVYLYNNNETVHHYIRFAFEGFFSLAETGEWNVASNNKLKTMYVFPETLKTWIVGDGYFDNPYYIDPYYQGPNFNGYYMETDAGYLRFIYYFGLMGLLAFSFFMIVSYYICSQSFPRYKWMFLFILLVNFIVWLKVSTDIFVIFALFLVIAMEVDKNNRRVISESNEDIL